MLQLRYTYKPLRNRLALLKANPQMQALQRSVGVGRLSVSSRDDATRIETLHQSGCTKIRLPETFNLKKEAVMINTAGGIAGGDNLAWDFEAKDNTSLTISSQACERYYRAGNETANIRIGLKVGKEARLNWLPQETILFDGANARRIIEVELESSSNLLMCEAVIFGRKAMDESLEVGAFSDRWRVSVDGVLIHAEDLKFQGELSSLLRNKGVIADNIAIANLLLIGEDSERKLTAARQIIGANGGASFWSLGATGKLVTRLIAKDSYELRKTLIPLITLLMGDEVFPKVWAI